MQAPDAVTTSLTGELPFILIVATFLAFPISLAILWSYRRAVVRGMRAAGMSGAASRPQVALPAAPPPAGTLRRTVAGPLDAMLLPPRAARLYGRMRQALWRSQTIYLAGGAAYAVIHAVTNSLVADGELYPLRILLLSWVYVWPAVITVGLIGGRRGRSTRLAAAGYFVVLLGLDVLGAAVNPGIAVFALTLVWLITNLAPTLLLLIFLNRSVRAIGPLVLAFMMLGLMGSSRLITLIGADDDRLSAVVGLGDAFELGMYELMAGIVLAGFAIVGALGWLLLRWIRARYERKRISDESLTIDSVWVLFSVVHSMTLVFAHVAWLLAGLAAFFAYKAVVAGGFALRTARAARPEPLEAAHPRLLVLRVFALGRRGQRLFDAVARRWRHAGSIYMIAGPDLATTAIEPHELLDFVTGNLANRFIDGPETLERRLDEADDAPDRDGRFRVNEFFCRDAAWREALSRLATRTEAVLMDLRGFSRANAGCVYELNELVDIVPLERVVLVLDDTTDADFLDATLNAAWADASADSPNRRGTGAAARIMHLDARGRSATDQALRALCAAATATEPQAATP